MKRTIVTLLLGTALMAGCARNTDGLSLTGPAPDSHFQLLVGPVLPSPTISILTASAWAGTTTPTGLGEAGTLSATFSFGAGDSFTADLTWTSGVSSLTYHGTVLAPDPAHITITAIEPSKCTYTAAGALSQDSKTLSGTYRGAGPGVCPQKTGAFVLTRKADEPTCPSSAGDNPGHGNNPGGPNDPQPCHGNDPGQGHNDHK